MARLDFYQLSRDPVEQVLPRIAERILAEGERLLIVADERERLDRVSAALWDAGPASFLAHDHDDAEMPEAQPILLSARCEPLNGATRIALADGRFRDEALAFDRAFYFFDDSSIDDARSNWRVLKGAEGVSLHFWRQEGKRWREGP